VNERFNATGTSHIIVISGFNNGNNVSGGHLPNSHCAANSRCGGGKTMIR
jgi:hypothetical protein